MKLVIKKEKLTNIFLIVFFVLIYFTPEFKYLPYYTWILSLIGLLIVGKMKWQRELHIMHPLNIRFVLLVIGSVIFLGVLIPILHFTFDFTYLPILIGIILCMFRNFLVVYMLKKNVCENLSYKYMDLFLYACCICVVFTLLFIAFPEFKNFWLNDVIVNNVSEKHANWAAYEFRYSIGGFAAYSYATIFSCAIVMAAYFICVNGATFKDIIRFILICVGGFFYGRITLFAMVIAGLMIFLKSKDIISLLKFLLFVGLGMLLLWTILTQLSTLDTRFETWSNWAFSLFEDIFVRKEITTYSINNTLNNMYFLPSLETIICGDGQYTDQFTGRYYMGTDVGYMRMLLYGGVVGVIVAFAPLFYIFRKLLKRVSDKNFKRFLLAIAAVWLVLEAKGESYFRIILVLYPLFLLSLEGDNVERSN